MRRRPTHMEMFKDRRPSELRLFFFEAIEESNKDFLRILLFIIVAESGVPIRQAHVRIPGLPSVAVTRTATRKALLTFG
jgi:hypothetical protein